MSPVLPQEMQTHTYAIMDRVEDSHWWFVGRRAILESFLSSIPDAGKIRNKKLEILDVGCGTGRHAIGMTKKGYGVTGLDICPKMLEQARSAAQANGVEVTCSTGAAYRGDFCVVTVPENGAGVHHQTAMGGTLRMTFIPLDATVQEGDLVITSGLGGNFPPDIVIGQVTSIRQFEFELYQEAEIRSLNNFDTLEIVLVITNF